VSPVQMLNDRDAARANVMMLVFENRLMLFALSKSVGLEPAPDLLALRRVSFWLKVNRLPPSAPCSVIECVCTSGSPGKDGRSFTQRGSRMLGTDLGQPFAAEFRMRATHRRGQRH